MFSFSEADKVFTDYIKSVKALSLLTEIIFIVVLPPGCFLFHIICHTLRNSIKNNHPCLTIDVSSLQ